MRGRSLIEFIILLLLVAILGQISQDYFRDPVVIDPIVVPKAFEERGYTPQAFAAEIRDEIDEIIRSAMTQAKKEGLVAGNNRESFPTVNKESYAVATGEALPDIEIPETTLSFRKVVDFLEGLLQLQPRHIVR